jgi:hypothetical protein
MSSGVDMTPEEIDELAPLASLDQKPGKSQADKLIELAESSDFFTQDLDEPFASVKATGMLKPGESIAKDSSAGYVFSITVNTKRRQAIKASRMR